MTTDAAPPLTDPYFCGLHDAGVLGARCECPEHDCATCQDCIHDGNQCCGCYDGACCSEPA